MKLELSAVESVWRPIHYLGSKLRFVEPLRQAVNSITSSDGSVCDVFAGSGTTALAFARDRRVFANDIQLYSKVICSALLSEKQDTIVGPTIRGAIDHEFQNSLKVALRPLLDYELRAFEENDADAIMSLISANLRSHALHSVDEQKFPYQDIYDKLSDIAWGARSGKAIILSFAGLYFSFRQAMDLATLAKLVSQQTAFKDIYLAALLSTISEIANTIGQQFAQPLQPRDKSGKLKSHLLKKIISDRNRDIFQLYDRYLNKYASEFNVSPGCEAHCGNYANVLTDLAGRIETVYADPPYTREHYSRYYHVLETIAREDDPQITTYLRHGRIVESQAAYRDDRHQSEFCIKTKAQAAFERLFLTTKEVGAKMVLSYSPHTQNSKDRGRVLPLDSLVAVAKKYFQHVELELIDGASHNKMNSTILNGEKTYSAEAILTCT